MTYSVSRILTLAFVMLAFIVPQASAQSSIGVIDLAKIIDTSIAGKDLQTKFKARKEAVQKEYIAYEKDLKSKEQTLMKDRKSLDEKAFNIKKSTFEVELKKKREDVVTKNVNLEKSKNESLKAIQTKVAQICADIAQEKKIEIVLDRGSVVIAQESLDMTADVIKKLDADLKSVPLK